MTSYDSSRYALITRWDPSPLRRVDQLLDLSNGQKVLEVGCGQGHLTKRLADRGVDIIGIDANPNAPEIAGTERVVFMFAEDLEYEDSSFDVVVAGH